MSVTATGTGTLGFQWYKDGAAIAGAVDSSLAFTSLSNVDAADYTVTVTDSVAAIFWRDSDRSEYANVV